MYCFKIILNQTRYCIISTLQNTFLCLRIYYNIYVYTIRLSTLYYIYVIHRLFNCNRAWVMYLFIITCKLCVYKIQSNNIETLTKLDICVLEIKLYLGTTYYTRIAKFNDNNIIVNYISTCI